MKISYFLTNFPKFLNKDYPILYTNIPDLKYPPTAHPIFYIDGYIMPRMEVFSHYRNMNQYEMLSDLYALYKEDFIKYIKGVFNIIIFIQDKVLIYNDIHSIKKVFIYRDKECFFISNDLNLIRNNFELSSDLTSIAIFCISSHFLNGKTLFSKINHSLPASKLEFSGKVLHENFYWNPNELFAEENNKLPGRYDFTEFWETLISNFLDYFKPSSISLTLTGGNDSRLLLAALIHSKYIPRAFCFGNPFSLDGYISSKVANQAGVDFQTYFVDNPTPDWFTDTAFRVIELGQTLINIHRAHRLDALEKHQSLFPDNDMLFSGLMGGEYLKEPKIGYLPYLFFLLEKQNEKNNKISGLRHGLECIGIRPGNIEIELIHEQIQFFLNQSIHYDSLKRKFLLNYYYYGCSHHTQDALIFDHYSRMGANPFMDPDFLDWIAASPACYINNKNIFRQFYHSELYVKTTNDLAPQLSKIPYAKKGFYTADDLTQNHSAYLVKRGLGTLFNNLNKYPSGFEMGKWLEDFSKKQLNTFHPELREFFNLPYLNSRIELAKDKKTEERWHVITNPINLSMYLKKYGKD